MTKSGKLRGFKCLTKEQIIEEKNRLEKAGIKLDICTGQLYTSKNIPMGRLNGLKTQNGTEYKIIAQSQNNDVWYNGKFIGSYYAVFVNTNRGFYQQISKWYFNYGNAVRYMTHNCK